MYSMWVLTEHQWFQVLHILKSKCSIVSFFQTGCIGRQYSWKRKWHTHCAILKWLSMEHQLFSVLCILHSNGCIVSSWQSEYIGRHYSWKHKWNAGSTILKLSFKGAATIFRLTYLATKCLVSFLNGIFDSPSCLYHPVYNFTTIQSMTHTAYYCLACSSRFNIETAAFYSTIILLLTVSQPDLHSFPIPTTMLDSQSMNISLIEVMTSSKNKRVYFHDLCGLKAWNYNSKFAEEIYIRQLNSTYINTSARQIALNWLQRTI